MKQLILKTPSDIISSNVMEDVERVKPRDFLKTFHIRSITPVLLIKTLLEQKKHLKAYVLSEANKIAEEQMIELEKMELPQQIHMVLDNDLSKKEQISLLKNISITKKQLGALFIQAGAKGYLFSNYQFEGLPKEYDESELPSLIFLKEDGNVQSYGKHKLSDGQLKDIVIRSRKIIARLLDKDNHWHCFYQTSSGIQGEEHGEFGSQPHIHYISDAFGVAREDLISAIKGGNAICSKIHILLK